MNAQDYNEFFFELRRDEKTGGLVTPYAEAVAKRSRELAGFGPPDSKIEQAMIDVGREKPELFAQHNAIRLADEHREYLADLPPRERKALTELYTREQAAQRASVKTPKPDRFAARIEDVLRTCFHGDRSRYGEAMSIAAKEAPELFQAYLRHDETELLTADSPAVAELLAEANHAQRVLRHAKNAELLSGLERIDALLLRMQEEEL